ncbi:hypothetical protein BD289DRAFT_444203 [Coniella lustricola]|uniref:Uncharacterized protein n=1 Tax=Coniella lustricola TaxID=2025994 RepID=A0A2T2ZW92_9PEZI|nr:hypothetical protein BD289DRAFT_444203 [Coniella lustricola]
MQSSPRENSSLGSTTEEHISSGGHPKIPNMSRKNTEWPGCVPVRAEAILTYLCVKAVYSRHVMAVTRARLAWARWHWRRSSREPRRHVGRRRFRESNSRHRRTDVGSALVIQDLVWRQLREASLYGHWRLGPRRRHVATALEFSHLLTRQLSWV